MRALFFVAGMCFVVGCVPLFLVVAAAGAVAGGVGPVDGMYCPVGGPVSFADTWGADRDGGRRRHKGADLFAVEGTPILAVTSGRIDRASPVERGLGGITLWLAGVDGHRYYYAHNRTNVVRAGTNVIAGQVIAQVGRTGNARRTPPHLHFEYHPDGGRASPNVFNLVDALCPHHT